MRGGSNRQSLRAIRHTLALAWNRIEHTPRKSTSRNSTRRKSGVERSTAMRSGTLASRTHIRHVRALFPRHFLSSPIQWSADTASGFLTDFSSHPDTFCTQIQHELQGIMLLGRRWSEDTDVSHDYLSCRLDDMGPYSPCCCSRDSTERSHRLRSGHTYSATWRVSIHNHPNT